MAEDFSFEYKANVKDKVKSLEQRMKSGSNDAIYSTPRKTKSIARNDEVEIPTIQIEPLPAVQKSTPDTNSAAVVDVEITQLDPQSDRKSQIQRTDSSGFESDLDSSNEEAQDRKLSVKNLLRRFSSGMAIATTLKRKESGPKENVVVDLELNANADEITDQDNATKSQQNWVDESGRRSSGFGRMLQFRRNSKKINLSLEKEEKDEKPKGQEITQGKSSKSQKSKLSFEQVESVSVSAVSSEPQVPLKPGIKINEESELQSSPTPKPRVRIGVDPALKSPLSPRKEKESKSPKKEIPEPSEISTLLEIGWQNVLPELRAKYPKVLNSLQKILEIKEIKKFSDLPEEPQSVLALLRDIPFQDPVTTDLLIETLQLRVPSCFPALKVGQGYDLAKDSPTQLSPFLVKKGLKTSPLGLIPYHINCSATAKREIVFKFYSSQEDFVLDRLCDLGIKEASFPGQGSTPPPSFHSTRFGYNLLLNMRQGQEPGKGTTATASVEYRPFQLSLVEDEVEFKEEFLDEVTALPEIEGKKAETVQPWVQFFQKWGSHVVNAAYAGGSIQVTFRGRVLSGIFKILSQDVKGRVNLEELETNKVFQWVTGDGLTMAVPLQKEDFLQGSDSNVFTSFSGGGMKFQDVDLVKLDRDSVAQTRKEWIQSLALNPIILDTNLHLIPLSYFVRKVSEGTATKMDLAFHHIYAGFMGNATGKQCNIL